MAPKSLEGRLHWSASGTPPHLWRAGGRIRLEDTGDRETLDLLASYNGRTATGRFVIRYPRVNPIRRLCWHSPNSHRNPPGQKPPWVGPIHKHRWDDEWKDRIAYHPDDIPDTHFMAALEAFLHECQTSFTADALGSLKVQERWN